MGVPKLKLEEFTYSQYLTWNDGKRWELIDGKAYDMSPAPNTRHQRVCGRLFLSFASYLKGKPCEAFIAPFDVRLAPHNVTDNDTLNVVQPDIFIICDSSKIDERGANGAPDLIVEILSESTVKKDSSIKLLLYQRYGVKEYWIIDPVANTVSVHKLDDIGLYYVDKIYKEEEVIKVGFFADLQIELKTIFEKDKGK